MKKPALIHVTADRLRELLDYNPETGVFTRKVTRGPSVAGSVAGNKRKNGYVYIMVDGVRYLAHRLAWFYVHGVDPLVEIDHKDRNPSNNAIANLRLADRSGNSSNREFGIPKSGFRGVYQQKRRWWARICKDGQHFNLGSFPTPEAAHAAYADAARKLFGEFSYAAAA